MVAVPALGALNEVLAALCAAARCTGSRSASWAEWDSDSDTRIRLRQGTLHTEKYSAESGET